MADKTIVRAVFEMKDKASGPAKKIGGAVSQTNDKLRDANGRFKKAGDSADKFGKSTDKAGKKAKKAATNYAALGGKILAFGLAAKGAMMVLKSFTQGLADSANQLSDTSTRTGVAVDTLAGLRLAAEGSGLQMATLASGLQQFPKRMNDMANGMGEAQRAFRALDIEVTNTDGSLRSADEVIRETMSKLAKVPDATTKAAFATELFGRSGTSLLQALGGSELEEFIEHAERFGIDIGPKALKASADWQREIANLGLVSEGAKEQFVAAFGTDNGGAGEVLKALGGVLIGLAAAFDSFMDAARKGLGMITKPIADTLVAVMELGDAVELMADKKFTEAARKVAGSMERLGKNLESNFEGLPDVLSKVFGPGAIAAGMAAAEDYWSAVTPGTGGGGGGGGGGGFVPPTTPPVVTTDEEEEAEEGPSIADNIAAALEGIAAFQSMAASLKDMPTQLALSVTKGVTGPLTDPLGAMLGMLGPAGAVVGALGALGDDMKGTIKAGIKSFFDALESLPEVIEFVIGDVVPRLISKLPTMLFSIALKIIPALIRGLFVEFPQAFAEGFVAGFRRMWKAITTFFREMFTIGGKGGFKEAMEKRAGSGPVTPKMADALRAAVTGGKKHGGARHIDRSGLALLQQGEAVIPSSGTTTQRQARGISAMMGGGGQTINITTHVVDPDAVGRLGQMLQNHYGAFGRSTQPIFGGT